MIIYDAISTMRVGEINTVGFRFNLEEFFEESSVKDGTVSVLPAEGLTPGSDEAIVTDEADGCYAWVTAEEAGTYYVKFEINFSDGKKLIRIYRVDVISDDNTPEGG